MASPGLPAATKHDALRRTPKSFDVGTVAAISGRNREVCHQGHGHDSTNWKELSGSICKRCESFYHAASCALNIQGEHDAYDRARDIGCGLQSLS